MPAHVLRTSAVALALTLAAGGCGATSGKGDKVAGSTLVVYVGASLNGPGAGTGRAIVNGAKLALADAGGRAGKHKVAAVYVDDTAGTPPRWSQEVAADGARQASEDTTALAFIGNSTSGATRVTLPITNQAGMPLIAPAATAVDLARIAGGKTPDRLQPSAKRSLARVVPADDVQAAAAAAWAKQLGARHAVAVNDGSDYGRVTATAFLDGARSEGLRVSGEPRAASRRCAAAPDTGVDAVYFGGPQDVSAAGLAAASRRIDAVACSYPNAQLFGSDALLVPELLGRTADFADRLRLTSSFIEPARLPRAGPEVRC